MDCELQQTSGKGRKRFRCARCGWTYRKLVRRNCPEAPEAHAARRSNLQATLRARLWAKCERGETCRPWEEVSADLDRCFASCRLCDDQRGCLAMIAVSCKRLDLWVTTLLLRPCLYYSPPG